MSLLVLGGTNDALRLADKLHQQGLTITYSLAGLVRSPNVDYTVIEGGFSQYGGIQTFIVEQGIIGIVDATHPYAIEISQNAAKARQECDIPYFQFNRPMWHPQKGDQWFDYENWNDLIPMLHDKQSVLITTGRLDKQTLTLLSTELDAQLIIRTAIKPETVSDTATKWIHAIGPFTREAEIALMQKYNIDAVVSKNSGGDATAAKLHAARQLGVPVYLLKRPESTVPQSKKINKVTHAVFSSLEQCEQAVLAYFK